MNVEPVIYRCQLQFFNRRKIINWSTHAWRSRSTKQDLATPSELAQWAFGWGDIWRRVFWISRIWPIPNYLPLVPPTGKAIGEWHLCHCKSYTFLNIHLHHVNRSSCKQRLDVNMGRIGWAFCWKGEEETKEGNQEACQVYIPERAVVFL